MIYNKSDKCQQSLSNAGLSGTVNDRCGLNAEPEAETASGTRSKDNFLSRLQNIEGLGPSTLSIIREAERRGIPWRRVNSYSRILLGQGKFQQQIRATISGKTSCMAVETADDKYETKILLEQAGIPVPKGIVCRSEAELHRAVDELSFPLVLKPVDSNHGKGVSINITDFETAVKAFAHARTYSSEVIIEKYMNGADHRMLVVNGKLVAAARRVPAHITGDDTSTIRQLIAEINKSPERGEGHEAVLTQITVDCDTERQLKKVNYRLDTIPVAGETVFLKSTANLSTGGIAIDVTEEVHPSNRFMAERIAALVGLDICGIDLVAPDLKTPVRTNGGAVIEVNAAPGFRMHLAPSGGKPRNVAAAVLDMLYPSPAPSRIPIFAVTGTNGKTTTTRLLAHIVQSCGYFPGYTTTDGIYIGGHQVESGDCSGPSSASLVLADPMVDFAVLETARGGLLRAGLAFDHCDVGIITNIAADHLGLQNINTLEELAEVKAAVVRSVKPNGWAILNAEDEHCVATGKTLSSRIGFFSLNRYNNHLQQHIASGGLAATVDEEKLIIFYENQCVSVAEIKDIPLTVRGTSKCMTANVLAATAAAFAYGLRPERIRNALMSFVPGPELTPGRMNHFKVGDFTVLVDYAHNPHGLRALKDYLNHFPAKRKTGIIGAVGDRRDCDIIELAEIATGMFDHIIVRQDHHLRGRTLADMNRLMISGIRNTDRSTTYELIPDEQEAIRHALSKAVSGELIVALSDNYRSVIEIVEEFQRLHFFSDEMQRNSGAEIKN